MKLKHLFVGLLLLISCNIYGQQKNSSQPQKTDALALEETVSLLQAENHAIKKQLSDLQNEIDYYRGDVREKVADFNDDLSQWLTIMAIMMAVVGIAIPIIINYRNEKSMEKMLMDVSAQAKDAAQKSAQAQIALREIEELKKHVVDIEERVNKDTLAAEMAAKEAKASQLFTQAFSEKDSLKAIELYTQAIDNNPELFIAYNNRANLKSDLGDIEGALKDYSKAIEIEPNDATSFYNRGNLKKKIGKFTDAVKDYDRAIELEPTNPVVFNNRADLFLIMGEYKKALEDINIAIKQEGSDYIPYVTRGEIYLAMDKPVDAISDFEHALSIKDGIKEVYIKRAKCYRKLAELEEEPLKKADFINKAEADKKKAESL